MWNSVPAAYFADLILVGVALAGFLFLRRYSRPMREIGAARAISFIWGALIIWASYNIVHLLALAWDSGIFNSNTGIATVTLQVESFGWLTRVATTSALFIGGIGLVQRFAKIHTALNDYNGTLEHELDSRSGVERALKAESVKYQSAIESRSEILHRMSIELRTPLNGILGLASLLGNTTLDKDQRNLLGMLDKSAHSMLGRLNNFLSLSRLDSGRVVARGTVFRPLETARTVEALFAPTASEKGLCLTVTHSDLATGEFIADEILIKQAVGNLISNAVKFTQTGSVILSVQTSLADDGRCWLSFSAVDTGIGLRTDDVERLANPALDVTNYTNGLGLPISHQIAHLLGGEITVTAEQGEGSTFTLRLPVERVDAVTAL